MLIFSGFAGDPKKTRTRWWRLVFSSGPKRPMKKVYQMMPVKANICSCGIQKKVVLFYDNKPFKLPLFKSNCFSINPMQVLRKSSDEWNMRRNTSASCSRRKYFEAMNARITANAFGLDTVILPEKLLREGLKHNAEKTSASDSVGEIDLDVQGKAVFSGNWLIKPARKRDEASELEGN